MPFGMVVGGTVACCDRWHRRLGDLVADTIVIRDVRRALPATLSTEKTRVNSFQSDAALRSRILTRVSRMERDLVMDLALRRDQMDPAIREELFGKAATHFRARAMPVAWSVFMTAHRSATVARIPTKALTAIAHVPMGQIDPMVS